VPDPQQGQRSPSFWSQFGESFLKSAEYSAGQALVKLGSGASNGAQTSAPAPPVPAPKPAATASSLLDSQNGKLALIAGAVVLVVALFGLSHAHR
jgi:hypothetical protein